MKQLYCVEIKRFVQNTYNAAYNFNYGINIPVLAKLANWLEPVRIQCLHKKGYI